MKVKGVITILKKFKVIIVKKISRNFSGAVVWAACGQFSVR